MKKRHIIYIPGLGRQYFGQQLLIQSFRLRGIQPHMFPSNWYADEVYADKKQRLLRLIDNLAGHDADVSLMAVSAGASLGLVVAEERPAVVNKVIIACGKILNPQIISPTTLQHNPAFGPSMAALQNTLAVMTPEFKQRVLTMSPLHDEIVAIADQSIDGVRSFTMQSRGHGFSIVQSVTRYSGVVAAFVKA